jgi:hypothetical protein
MKSCKSDFPFRVIGFNEINDPLQLDQISDRKEDLTLYFYPEIRIIPQIDAGTLTRIESASPFMSTFRVKIPVYQSEFSVSKIQNNKYLVKIPGHPPSQINDLFLDIDYYGDTGMGFLDGKLVTDNFFNGSPWTIGLKRFNHLKEDTELVLNFRPLYSDAPFLRDLRSSGIVLSGEWFPGFELNRIGITPQYKVRVKL